MSIDNYIKFISVQKQNMKGAVNLGNRSDENHDDKNAGMLKKNIYLIFQYIKEIGWMT